MRRIVMAGTAVLAVAVLGGCSGGSGGDSMQKSMVDHSENDSTAGGSVRMPSALDREAGGSLAPESQKLSGPRASGTAPQVSITESRIRTAELTVSVTGAANVTLKADAAGDIALRAGGQIDGDDRTSGKHATATLRLRVPPTALQESLTALSKLGKASSRHLTSRDVTSQVADVKSRVGSAQQAIGRLRALYANATKVADVISIEQELSSREADLESLQAQQRALSTQTELASITLSLRTASTPAPPKEKKDDRTGFLGGLYDGWDVFTSAASAVAVAAGAVLPFAVLLLVVGAALRLLWPRLRPTGTRRPSPAPVGPAE